MRPIVQTSGTIGSASYRFAPVVPDIMLTPGNATWIVKNTGSGSASANVALYFSNDDPFQFWTNGYGSDDATWIQEQAAFQNASGTVVSNVTLTAGQAVVGAYSYLPRGVQFRLSSCTSNPNIVVQFVQSSGGRS